MYSGKSLESRLSLPGGRRCIELKVINKKINKIVYYI